MVEAGDAAPDFELETESGKLVRLADFRGRRVVLFFYPKDDTSGCTKEACGFRDRLAGFDSLDTIVLGVSPDDAPSHRKFREKYGLNFPLLVDSDHAVAEAYGTWGRKKLYGREYEGILRSTFVIDRDGRIEKAYRNVRPADHAEQVLKDLSQ